MVSETDVPKVSDGLFAKAVMNDSDLAHDVAIGIAERGGTVVYVCVGLAIAHHEFRETYSRVSRNWWWQRLKWKPLIAKQLAHRSGGRILFISRDDVGQCRGMNIDLEVIA